MTRVDVEEQGLEYIRRDGGKVQVVGVVVAHLAGEVARAGHQGRLVAGDGSSSCCHDQIHGEVG